MSEGNEASTPDKHAKPVFDNARYAWFMPLAGMLASMLIHFLVPSLGAVGGILFIVTILIGIGYSVLCIRKRREQEGVLVHGIVGMILNLALIAMLIMAVLALMRAREAAERANREAAAASPTEP